MSAPIEGLANTDPSFGAKQRPWYRPLVLELVGNEAARKRRYFAEIEAAREPPDRYDKAARRAFFVAEISDFLATRRERPDAYMSAPEIGAANDRAYLLQRALLDGVAFCHREAIGAGERGTKILIGVLVTDTIYSDNDQGCSTVSAARTAGLLGCSEKSVLRAREILVANRVMCREGRPGLGDKHWPVINRAIAGQATSTIWWLDATSDPPAPRGQKPRTAAVHPFAKTQDPCGPPFSDKARTPAVQNPGPLGSDNSTLHCTEERKGGAASEYPGPQGSGVAPPPKDTTNGHQHWLKDLNPDAAARKAYARDNVMVSMSGKVSIGPEFRVELLADGFTDSHIAAALAKVCRYIEGSDAEKWLKSVRTACSWAQEADKKAAAFAPRKTGSGTTRTGRQEL